MVVLGGEGDDVGVPGAAVEETLWLRLLPITPPTTAATTTIMITPTPIRVNNRPWRPLRYLRYLGVGLASKWLLSFEVTIVGSFSLSLEA